MRVINVDTASTAQDQPSKADNVCTTTLIQTETELDALEHAWDGLECRIMSQPRQRGFLAAVDDLVNKNSAARDAPSFVPSTVESFSDVMLRLLHAAERGRVRRILALVNQRSLWRENIKGISGIEGVRRYAAV